MWKFLLKILVIFLFICIVLIIFLPGLRKALHINEFIAMFGTFVVSIIYLFKSKDEKQEIFEKEKEEQIENFIIEREKLEKKPDSEIIEEYSSKDTKESINDIKKNTVESILKRIKDKSKQDKGE